MKNWINASSNNENIVLNSSIRLSRNIKDVFFPNKLNNNESRKIVKNVEDIFYSSINNSDAYSSIYTWDDKDFDYMSYVDKDVISEKFLINKDKTAFIISNDETISILINEQDHLKIQCITEGFNLQEAYKNAQQIDDMIEEKLEYAFDESLGYLTSCPTDVGTGLRASVVLHLPALHMANEINGVLNVLTQVGMTISGMYGEKNECVGSIFKISNQLTLGLNENEIINNLKAVVEQIINEEKICRDKLLGKYKNEIKDKIYRALGILKTAFLLDIGECLTLLSYVRLGVDMNIIDVEKSIINELMVSIHPCMLEKICNKNEVDQLGHIRRAKLVKNKLGRLIN